MNILLNLAMNRLTTSILFGVVWLALTSCSRKQDPLPWRLETYLQAAQQHDQFQGSVLVATGDRIEYERQVGYADIGTKRLIDAETMFELASVSKQFTATGVLILAERGKLSLSDSLRHFFPDLPYTGVTLHHLLTHTSGMPDYEELAYEKWDHSRIAFNADMIRLLAEYKPSPLFRPGEEWRYSNTGFMLLASIIEKVSGQSFGEFLQAHIFEPLGMARTRVYNTRRSGEKIDNYAYGYVSDSTGNWVLPDSLPAFREVYYLDGIQGDGVVNSTARDLLKWHLGLRDGKVVSAEWLTKAYTPVVLNSGKTADYGYGWSLRTDSVRGKIVEHGGSWPGYGTYITRLLDQDKVIIILSNTQKYIQDAVEALVFNEPVEMPNRREWVDPPSDLSPWVGQFVSLSESDTLVFFAKEANLYSKYESLEYQWRYASDGRFYLEAQPGLAFGIDRKASQDEHYLVVRSVKKRLVKL